MHLPYFLQSDPCFMIVRQCSSKGRRQLAGIYEGQEVSCAIHLFCLKIKYIYTAVYFAYVKWCKKCNTHRYGQIFQKWISRINQTSLQEWTTTQLWNVIMTMLIAFLGWQYLKIKLSSFLARVDFSIQLFLHLFIFWANNVHTLDGSAVILQCVHCAQ